MMSGNSTLQREAVSRSEQVRSVFENTPKYLSNRGVDVRCRMQVVSSFCKDVPWKCLLDIGCGDGSISLPLLRQDRHLTLIDLSTGMIASARKKISPELTSNVRMANVNFMDAKLEDGSFDLVIMVGVLAHVDSPSDFIAEIKRVLRPGGSVIMEFTDSRHQMGRLARLWGQWREVLAPAAYATHLFSASDVLTLWARHGFAPRNTFRYARLPLPGVHRLFGSSLEYKLVQLIFGTSDKNRNVRLGNEYICLLKAE